MLQSLPRRRTDYRVDEDVTSATVVPEGVLMDTPSNRSGYHAHRIELSGAPGATPADLEAPLQRWLAHHGEHGVGRALLLFEADGLELEAPRYPGDFECRVFTCMRLSGSASGEAPQGAEIRALTPDEIERDWLRLHQRINPGQSEFGAWAATVMSRRVEAGRATQWGAFVDGALVSVCATVSCDERETRFQEVMTHPEHRRRGLATGLVAHAARTVEKRGEVWIVPDRGSAAERMYAAIGFEPRTTSVELSAPTPRTEAQLRAMLGELEAGTLPMDRWGHRDHLAAAALLLRDRGLEVAPTLAHLRGVLTRYLAVLGVESTPDSGYHETLTRGWLEVVAAELRTRTDQTPAQAALGVELAFSDKRHLLRYWSRERMMSAEARASWVEPDLAPIGG